MSPRPRTVRWNASAAPGGGTRVVVRGLLVGGVPRTLVRDVRALLKASRTLLLDLSELDGADTPAADGLRVALTPLRGLRVLLPGEWTPASHVLRAALAGAVPLQDERRRRMRERRRHHRYATRVEVRISLETGEVVTCVSTDVSQGGVRAALRARRSNLPVGAAVRVEIPALGLKWRAAKLVARDASNPRALLLAFDEACTDLFVA